jgi:hypothetical protein
MKLIAEDDYSIVTIVDKSDGVSCSDAIGLCRRLLMGLGFHPDTLAALMPDEAELDDIIASAIKSEFPEPELIKKELDTTEGLTEYTP